MTFSTWKSFARLMLEKNYRSKGCSTVLPSLQCETSERVSKTSHDNSNPNDIDGFNDLAKTLITLDGRVHVFVRSFKLARGGEDFSFGRKRTDLQTMEEGKSLRQMRRKCLSWVKRRCFIPELLAMIKKIHGARG